LYEEAALAKEPKEKSLLEDHTGTDLFDDIRRLEKLIRKQMINYKKSKTDEYKVKYSDSICRLISRKFDISCVVLKLDELIKGKTYYNKSK